jgi:hypothetical protein
MSKINLDKYYTDTVTAKRCIDLAFTIIGEGNISHIIEPSAGNGAFSLQLECDAYDIEPEHPSVSIQDYLVLDEQYMTNRLIIGNPPFGAKMNLAQQFFKKSITLGDYVAFILPISQLSNTNSLFEFDLIHSEDLGKIKYSDRNLHCCFNIYKRPINALNKRPSNKIKGVRIIRQDSKNYNDITDYDLRMCYWGNGSAGKILEPGQSYSAEYKILIDADLKEEVISVLSTINWFEELNCIAMLKIQQFHILHVLRKYITRLK